LNTSFFGIIQKLKMISINPIKNLQSVIDKLIFCIIKPRRVDWQEKIQKTMLTMFGQKPMTKFSAIRHG